MTFYIAEWLEGHDLHIVRFPAKSWRAAENKARKRGWELRGQYVDDDEVPLDVAAQIEKHVRNPTVH